MALRAGSLDRSIALVRRGPAGDNGFEATPGDWQLLGRRRASVKPLGRRDGNEGEARVARREISLWLRFDTLTQTLIETDALVHDGQLYELVAEPMEVGRREGVELIAVAAKPAVPIDVDALADWAP